MDVRIGFDEIRRLVWWFLKKESIFLSSPVLVFFTLRFYLGAAFVLRLLHTWLIGGGLWCDIELLKRATALLLPSFSCTFSATLCALRLILSQPYILCLSSLRRASFSRYFTHHPLGRGVGFFFPLLPFASSRHAKLSILHTSSPHMHRKPNFPNEISDAQPAIFAFGVFWGSGEQCLRNVFFFLLFPHTKHTHALRTRNTRTGTAGKKKNGTHLENCALCYRYYRLLLTLWGFFPFRFCSLLSGFGV